LGKTRHAPAEGETVLAALGTVIVTSLSGVMAPGPMFAVTLAKSLKSPWAGVLVSLGHAVVEVPLILLVYFGIARFFQNEVVSFALALIGGAMIVWMGVGLFRDRRVMASEGRDTPYNAFMAGILMSGLNPFFLVWWVTVGSLLLQQFLDAVGSWGLPFFIIVHWLCDLVWLSIVSFSIFRTRTFWSERAQEWVFVYLAAALAFFGGQFIVKGLDSYFSLDIWGVAKYAFWAALALVFVVQLVLEVRRRRPAEPV
jgi:threonine/homoserine/homoserine lactone efflux protein